VRPAYACSLEQPEGPEDFIAESEVILIGRATRATETELEIEPEAFLKGPASGEPFVLPLRDELCPPAEVRVGQRLLIYMLDASEPEWPLMNQVYVLQDGHANRPGEAQRTEVEVVSHIRGVTGQYIVPAASESEGAGIDWESTVLPLGVVLVVIFGIGLVLMRVWHRIDPS